MSLKASMEISLYLHLQNALLQQWLITRSFQLHKLQDPLRGGRDELLEDIVALIHEGDGTSQAKDVVAPLARRLVPELMLQLARKISPFRTSEPIFEVSLVLLVDCFSATETSVVRFDRLLSSCLHWNQFSGGERFAILKGGMEPMDIVGKSKEDVSLPKATMFKIIKEMLPPDVRVARDTQDLLVECCVEFINLVSSESNEVCNREEKKTIAPEHVLRALEVLGFGEYIEEVYAAYEQHRLETLSEEKLDLHDNLKDSPKGGRIGGLAMTEEEAAAEQQRMFAEARARMNNGVGLQKQVEADHSLEGHNIEHL
ncbi:hypothetical protein HPP92_003445 [Vanilla planifolia]|uniref:Transcription factor CBF/NF-Y/archaeal histone domain-containing protein n=1 Tax=Vanilla planifolia TaxID=51239 RepID=A0A835SGN9_VANPL|nr:hypothetical protein HPP92_003445 [Vanilla planifolia]